MTRSTIYDSFVTNELDPVACLEPAGINESNKFNPVKLAGVLASFGDFKDKKYRLKIKKDQATMIQAVRYLLEKSATEHKLGKRQSTEAVKESARAKRQKYREQHSTELKSLASELNISAENKSDGCTSLDLETEAASLDEEDVEAALTLQSLAQNLNTQAILSSARGLSDSRVAIVDVISENKVRKDPSTHVNPEAHDWFLDKDLHGSHLKGMLVTISTSAFPKDSKHYSDFAGRFARLFFMFTSANEVLARVKLLKPAGGCSLPPCLETGVEYGSEIRLPAKFLAPVLPEKYGDQVVVLHGKSGVDSDMKGIRGRVHAVLFAPDKNLKKPVVKSDEKEVKDEDLVDFESEIGRKCVPRTCLAKCAF